MNTTNTMNTVRNVAVIAVATAMLLGLGACSGMSARDESTAIGAGVGAVGGAVLTGGSAIGTVGGAAVGGLIGNQVGKDK
jgi:osmotically inducible lipoprotein OsmB